LFVHAIYQPCSCFCHWSASLSTSFSVLQFALTGKGFVNCDDGNDGAQEPKDDSNILRVAISFLYDSKSVFLYWNSKINLNTCKRI
jgi:hypothetical protein